MTVKTFSVFTMYDSFKDFIGVYGNCRTIIMAAGTMDTIDREELEEKRRFMRLFFE